MRVLLLPTCLFLSVFANAQELKIPKAHYPTLPKSGSTVDDFVPKDWKIEIQAKGDLNSDGLEDIVFLLQEDNPKNIVKNSGSGESTLNTNPRILAIIFAEKDGNYSLAASNNSLIPRYTNPLLNDYIESDAITYRKGVFYLSFDIFPMSASDRREISYNFRWQNNRFELIGYDSREINRADGDAKSISINYSTRKVRTMCYNVRTGEEEKVIWKKLPSNKIWTIDNIGNGIEFKPGVRAVCE